MWEIGANDQIFKAVDYQPLVVAYHNGTAVRIADIGRAVDSTEDIRNAGYANGKPSVLLILFRQPGANIIETVDRVRALLPQLKAEMPQSIDMRVAMDQTVTIRASVRDTERTLIISVVLVILVVFVFLAKCAVDADSERRGSRFAHRHIRSDVLVRLQPGQPVADGVDDLDRIRGGRRHRGDREHHPLSRAWHASVRGSAEGSPRNWLHGDHDQPLAGGGVHSVAADGRSCRPAVPRVCHHTFGRDRRVHAGFAHDHSHDVRLPPETAHGTRASFTGSRSGSSPGSSTCMAGLSRSCCGIRSSR